MLLTESAQSNQVVRVLPAVQAYSFVSCFFASGVGGGGEAGQKLLVYVCIARATMFDLKTEKN